MFWLIFIPKIVFSYMMCIIKVKRKGSRAMWAFKDAIIRCGMYIHDMTKICSTMGKPNIKIFVSVGQTTFLVKAVIIPIWSFSINHMLFWRDWKTRTTLANVINGNYWIIDQWKYLSYYYKLVCKNGRICIKNFIYLFKWSSIKLGVDKIVVHLGHFFLSSLVPRFEYCRRSLVFRLTDILSLHLLVSGSFKIYKNKRPRGF